MRRECDKLDGLLEFIMGRFINEDCQNNRNWETSKEAIDTDSKCVGYNPFELIGLKECFEMEESYPRTAPNPVPGAEFLKGNLNPKHGSVTKDNDHQHWQRHDQIKLPAPAYLLER
jgi:hypothetical protein